MAQYAVGVRLKPKAAPVKKVWYLLNWPGRRSPFFVPGLDAYGGKQ